MEGRDCAVCGVSIDNGDQIALLTEKGADGINTASVLRDLTINVRPGEKVHVACRSRFCNKTLIEQDR